ncbi:hypothetical protein SESBI_31104 [Sesbania bispinosa]|nr:hypothetical protein SESBI_31104 [Sesbania bispinosa]
MVKDAHVVEMCNAWRENNGEVEIFFLHPVDLPCIIVDENSDSGEQSQKPVDVTDHTAIASPESTVSPPVPQPMTSCEIPHVAAPMESPLPTPIVSPVPTPVPSPVPSPVPTLVPSLVPTPEHAPEHTPMPSPESDFSDDYESVEDNVYRPSSHEMGVSVSGSRKKGKNICGCGGNSNRGEIPDIYEEDELGAEDEVAEENEVFLGGSIGHRQTYTHGMPTEPHGGP